MIAEPFRICLTAYEGDTSSKDDAARLSLGPHGPLHRDRSARVRWVSATSGPVRPTPQQTVPFEGVAALALTALALTGSGAPTTVPGVTDSPTAAPGT